MSDETKALPCRCGHEKHDHDGGDDFCCSLRRIECCCGRGHPWCDWGAGCERMGASCPCNKYTPSLPSSGEPNEPDTFLIAWPPASSGEQPPTPPSAYNPRNWPEDAGHENGEYVNRCIFCDQTFVGHKRRVACKQCAPESLVTDAHHRAFLAATKGQPDTWYLEPEKVTWVLDAVLRATPASANISSVPSETDVEALLKQIDNSFGLDDDASTRIKFKSLRSLATALREARDTGSAGTPCTRCGKDILWAIDDNKWLCQACQRISDLESELAESRAALQRAEAERDEWKRLHDADTRILDDIERTVESAEIESWDEEQNPIQLADRVDILSDKRDAAENDLAVERTRAERAEAERDEARSQLARSLQKP